MFKKYLPQLIAGILLLGIFGYATPTFAQTPEDWAVVKAILDKGVPLLTGPSVSKQVRSLPETQKTLLELELKKRAAFGTITDDERTIAGYLGLTLKEDIFFELKTKASKDRVFEVIRAKGTSQEQQLYNNLSETEKRAVLAYHGEVSRTAGLLEVSADRDITEGVACDLTKGSTYLACIRDALVWLLGKLIYWLSWLVWLAGQILDFAIKIAVRDFAKFANLPVFREIWAIGRDISNLFFIFILLYSAFDTLLSIGKAPFEKTLVPIITVAILINFSFPISRVFIDVSNIFANEIYRQINPDPDGKGDVSAIIASHLRVFEKTQLQHAVRWDSFETKGQANLPGKTPPPSKEIGAVLVGFIGSFVVLSTFTLTLLIAAAFLIKRTVVLLIVMTFSAMAFFSQLLPKTAKYYNRWWANLLDESMFAPVYLLFLYFAIRVLSASEGILLATYQSSSTVANSIGTQMVGAAIFYIMVLFILNMAISLTSEIGGEGAKAAMAWAEKGRDLIFNKPVQYGKAAAGYVAGGTANFAARRFAAPVIDSIASSSAMKNFAARSQTGAALMGTLKAQAKEGFGQKARTEAAKKQQGVFKAKEVVERARVLASYDERTRNQMFDQMTDEERAKIANLLDNADFKAGGAYASEGLKIQAAVDEYNGNPDQAAKLSKARKDEATKAEVASIVKKLATGSALTPADFPNVPKLSWQTIVDNKGEILKTEELFSYLSVAQFNKLVSEGNLTPVEVATINSYVDATAGPNLPRLAKLKKAADGVMKDNLGR